MGVWNPGPGATAGNDTFTGDATFEVASGLDGNDTMHGNGGNDDLSGNEGDDHLYGGDGDDDDSLDGGAGFDTVRYDGATIHPASRQQQISATTRHCCVR